MEGVFTKTCPSKHARDCEARNDERLRAVVESCPAKDVIGVPMVLHDDEDAGTRRLRIAKVRANADALRSAEGQRQLGVGLAHMHKATFVPCARGQTDPHGPMARFGLEEDNYIGVAPQQNGWSPSWGEFFVTKRLEAKMKEIDDEKLRDKFLARLKAARAGIIAFLDRNCDGASLLHGDLWSGNVLVDEGHHGWLIDPACYYGDREADLAMSCMFGGFTQDFYDGYDSVFPRTAAFRKKTALYNLYHYLNHLVIFGHGYLRGCLDGLDAMERIANTTVVAHDEALSG